MYGFIDVFIDSLIDFSVLYGFVLRAIYLYMCLYMHRILSIFMLLCMHWCLCVCLSTVGGGNLNSSRNLGGAASPLLMLTPPRYYVYSSLGV